MGRYNSSIKEDEEKMASSDLPSRERYALYTVYGQKRLLQALIDKCV